MQLKLAPKKVTLVLVCYVCPLIIPKQWKNQLRRLNEEDCDRHHESFLFLEKFHLCKDGYLWDGLQRETNLNPLVRLSKYMPYSLRIRFKNAISKFWKFYAFLKKNTRHKFFQCPIASSWSSQSLEKQLQTAVQHWGRWCGALWKVWAPWLSCCCSALTLRIGNAGQTHMQGHPGQQPNAHEELDDELTTYIPDSPVWRRVHPCRWLGGWVAGSWKDPTSRPIYFHLHTLQPGCSQHVVVVMILITILSQWTQIILHFYCFSRFLEARDEEIYLWTIAIVVGVAHAKDSGVCLIVVSGDAANVNLTHLKHWVEVGKGPDKAKLTPAGLLLLIFTWVTGIDRQRSGSKSQSSSPGCTIGWNCCPSVPLTCLSRISVLQDPA